MQHIGERIKYLRDKRRFTQMELATRSGVPQSLISRLESGSRGNPSADVLRGLATALGCTTDYLIGMHEEQSTDSEYMAAAAS